MQNDNIKNEIETAAISGLAATSKTPFRTAFVITIGIGLGRLFLFLLAVSGIVAIYKLV